MTKEDQDFCIARFKGNWSDREKRTQLSWLVEDLFDKSLQHNLSSEELEQLSKAIDQLNAGKPIQHVTGIAHFYDLTLRSDKRGLIPRPETEELVHRALSYLNTCTHPRVLDVCSGSGNIPIAIKHNHPEAEVLAMELSSEALDLSKLNAEKWKTEIRWLHHDALLEWPEMEVMDIITSNPPYIPESDKTEMDKNVLDHDPAMALFVPNTDPLKFYKALTENGFMYLKKEGWLAMEIHHSYGEEVKVLGEEAGFQYVEVIQDLNGNDRFVWAKK